MHFPRLFSLFLLATVSIGGCHRAKSADDKANRTLHLFAWSEYIPREVIDGFTRETGIKVDYEVYDSNEAMLAKLAPGSAQYDVIQPSEYAVEHLIKRNMLAPLDLASLPNLQNILPEYRNLPYDPDGRYSVPYMSGTVGIVVNSKTVNEPIRGYRDVFSDKYKNRIIVVNDNREIVSWAFEAQGIPINDVTEQNLARVKPTLTRWVGLIKIYNSDNPKAPLLSDDVNLGVVYSGDAAALWQQDKKFKYVLPAEGAHRFIDNLCIPAGSKNKEAATAFINYILRPQVGKIISDNFPYTNPNGAARKLLSKEQLDNPASYPSDVTRLEIFRDIGKASGDIQDLMSQLRQAASHGG